MGWAPWRGGGGGRGAHLDLREDGVEHVRQEAATRAGSLGRREQQLVDVLDVPPDLKRRRGRTWAGAGAPADVHMHPR